MCYRLVFYSLCLQNLLLRKLTEYDLYKLKDWYIYILKE